MMVKGKPQAVMWHCSQGYCTHQQTLPLFNIFSQTLDKSRLPPKLERSIAVIWWVKTDVIDFPTTLALEERCTSRRISSIYSRFQADVVRKVWRHYTSIRIGFNGRVG
jgi:hypothetical protein